jgi:hypothetical protein
MYGCEEDRCGSSGTGVDIESPSVNKGWSDIGDIQRGAGVKVEATKYESRDC